MNPPGSQPGRLAITAGFFFLSLCRRRFRYHLTELSRICCPRRLAHACQNRFDSGQLDRLAKLAPLARIAALRHSHQRTAASAGNHACHHRAAPRQAVSQSHANQPTPSAGKVNSPGKMRPPRNAGECHWNLGEIHRANRGLNEAPAKRGGMPWIFMIPIYYECFVSMRPPRNAGECESAATKKLSGEIVSMRPPRNAGECRLLCC